MGSLEDGRAATARWWGSMSVGSDNGRLQAVDGDYLLALANLEPESDWRAGQDLVGAFVEWRQWRYSRCPTNQHVGGGLECLGN